MRTSFPVLVPNGMACTSYLLYSSLVTFVTGPLEHCFKNYFKLRSHHCRHELLFYCISL